MSFPYERPYRERHHYQFRTGLSGLERPRQWLGVFVTAVSFLLVFLLISLLFA